MNSSPSFGFIVLSHNHPPQLLRLVQAINRLYDSPPIACHHDFSQSALDERSFPENVAFVRPHNSTRWGHISMVQGAIRAAELLYERSMVSWCTLLSACDYPIARAETVLRDLESGGADVYLDYREVTLGKRVDHSRKNEAGRRGDYQFDRPYWINIAAERYLKRHYFLPGFSHPIHIANPFLLGLLGKAPKGFFVYGGDHWFTMNRRAAALLIESPLKPKLMKYFRGVASPAEAFYQTLFCNSSLKLCNRNYRFSRWTKPGPHPDLLTVDDLETMIASGCHFARKFNFGDPVIEEIDRRLGISAEAPITSTRGLSSLPDERRG